MPSTLDQNSSVQPDVAKRASVRALERTNFFPADVQAGTDPFVAVYLASIGWLAGSVGKALPFGGIVTVLLQTPAGWIVDRVQWKRTILILGSLVPALGAILFALSDHPTVVYIVEHHRACTREFPEREVKHIDHKNSIGRWPERGLLDTQSGPNKNRKKW